MARQRAPAWRRPDSPLRQDRGVDIPRAPVNRGRKRILYGAIALVALVATTLGLRSLKPAAPRVDRASIWIDSVQKGPLVIEVRGPGTLVPERIRYISAVTAGRVERRLAEPGQEVQPETVLLELSNPDVQLEALESERQLTVAQADRVNLQTDLETQRLNQEAAVAAAKAAYQDAKRNAEAAEELAAKELISAMEASRALDRVEELETRYEVEEQRLAVMVGAADSQLALQKAQVGRLDAVTEFQRGRVRSMKVLAGAARHPPGAAARGGAVGPVRRHPGAAGGAGQAQGRAPHSRDAGEGRRRSASPPAIDTRNGIVKGKVRRIDPAVQNGTVTVDVSLEGELPRGARPDLSVDGTIEVERLNDVLHVGRPAYGQANSAVGLFKLTPDGTEATRVNVRLGRTSVNTVEIVGGLQPGDKVIISDMSRWDGYDRVRVD